MYPRRLALLLPVLVLAACTKDKDAPKPGEAASKSSSSVAQPAPAAAKATDNGPSIELTYDTALARGGELAGKTVVVTAMSWGAQSLNGGGKRIDLGDKPLTGLRQTRLVADFADADLDLDTAPAKDSVAKVRCTMGEVEYGAQALVGCKLVK